MDVKDVYKKKLELAFAVTALVNTFQKETGVKVIDFDLHHRESVTDQPGDVYETGVLAVLP